MTDPLPSDAPAPAEGSLRNVRIWSPLAVAGYGLLLGYPSSLLLAVKNWRALGLRDRILPHVVGAALLTVPLVGILVLSSPRVGRIFSLAMHSRLVMRIDHRPPLPQITQQVPVLVPDRSSHDTSHGPPSREVGGRLPDEPRRWEP